MDTTGLVEIRWHGRGGQGAVTSAELLAKAVIDEGKYAQAFPAFGAERRGAPVLAFNRINSREPIRIRAEVTEPDVVVVLDPGLLGVMDVTSGLKEKGVLIINTKRPRPDIATRFGDKWQLAVIDATRIARELLGVPIVNTTMLGALAKVTGVVRLESLSGPLRERFGRLAERNITAMKKAFEETVVKE
ncbi:MAG: 2-oxoacid:acceptor oxidoreductase family protein [Chloroflexi bacterium]|nr:2-oxoacid:acceptor oxidoreductase family protein [Chloroflexota bacterium]MBI3040145.1 2-oxoacid:acceptor oxidoreductase family protein [Chloroflexota bacterium]